jgi:heat-inducible transcriptional repressor
LIAANGMVEQAIARLPVASVNEEWLVGVRDRIRDAIVGQDFRSAEDAIAAMNNDSSSWASEQEIDVVRSIYSVIADQLNSNPGERLALAGTANLVKTEVDFSHSVSPLLEAIEEQVTLVKLFSELAADEHVRASIGRENDQYGLPETAIVTGTYESSPDSSSKVAVVGSMRMDYAGNIAAVRAVARYLSKTLGDDAHSPNNQR